MSLESRDRIEGRIYDKRLELEDLQAIVAQNKSYQQECYELSRILASIIEANGGKVKVPNDVWESNREFKFFPYSLRLEPGCRVIEAINECVEQ